MKVLLLLVPLALTVAACSTSSEAEPAIRPLAEATTSSTSTPSTTTAPVTTTTAEPDPWARPANPDAAYFERVLNELQRRNTEASRLLRDEAAVTPEVEAILRATRVGLNLQYGLEAAAADAEDFPEGVTLERAPVLSAVAVLELNESCALLEATISFDGVQAFERDEGRFVNRLLSVESTEINPTGWATEQRWTVENAPDLTCSNA